MTLGQSASAGRRAGRSRLCLVLLVVACLGGGLGVATAQEPGLASPDTNGAMGAPSGVAVGQPNADELYLRPGDDMAIAFEGLMSLRTKIVAPK